MFDDSRPVAVRVAAWILAAGVALSASPQQTPVFRGGIDVVSVDVVVLDKAGAPVTTLTSDDFTIVAGRKARRIVATEYINAKPPARTATAASVPLSSSNRRATVGRTLIFVVDVENILAGGGRLAMKSIGDYLDRLGPDDRAGLVALPTGTPRVEPTTNRPEIRAALTGLIGTSMRLRIREMTFGEAAGIAVGDLTSLLAFWSRIADQSYASGLDRSCSPPKTMLNGLTRVPQVCVQEAERVVEQARFHTHRMLGRLRALAEAMAPIAGPKAIVLASGGTLVDQETLAEMLEFATAAERSRVSLYSLFIEPMPGEAADAAGPTSETRRLDGQVALAGLADIALSARGFVERVLGASTVALARIDRELSGYYLLSFEQDLGDREGARVGIDVKTTRDGLTVIARKEFTATRVAPETPPAGVPADLKAAVGNLLKSAAVSQVSVEVDAFALPLSGAGGEARVILAVELGCNPSDVAALGFQVADARGKVMADGYDAPAKVQAKGDGRSIFVTTVPLSTGHFTARFGVIDAQGRRGSLQHTFDVPPWPDGAIRVSDPIFGDTGAGGFRPGARLPPGAGALAIRVVVRDSTSGFVDVRVRALVTRAADDSSMENLDVPLQQTPDPLRRFADAELAVSRYPPGEYVVRTVVTARGVEIGGRRRGFTK